MKKYKWICQDNDGFIKVFCGKKPRLIAGNWETDKSDWYRIQKSTYCNIIPLRINLRKFNYKIDDGILINVEKENPNRHKHADLMIAYANDKTLKIQFRYFSNWEDIKEPSFMEEFEYRINPELGDK